MISPFFEWVDGDMHRRVTIVQREHFQNTQTRVQRVSQYPNDVGSVFELRVFKLSVKPWRPILCYTPF